jgi:DNA-binding response OmpR family regulator
MRILLVANDDDLVQLIRTALATSTTFPFQLDHASSGWEAQRQAAGGAYAALVVDNNLGDTDGAALVGRLKAIGVDAPALLLQSTHRDQVEGLNANSLIRAIVAMVQRHDLSQELAGARNQAARAMTVLNDLTHDLATPLGVVMGMTQVLLSDDNGLNADGRACLEDVSREALRACQILKRFDAVDPVASVVLPVVTRGPDPGRASIGPESKMVLIADDDPATRRLVSATLASNQYSVLQAADGQEAWRLIREHHPAVAILDWQMPVYTGLELTDVIKGDPQVRGMTVIMLTGRNSQADREAGQRAHADLYLTKPFSPQDLLGAVEQALGIN